MSDRLSAFGGIGLNEALLESLLREHATVRVPRLEMLWNYYRNALRPLGDEAGGTTSRTRSGSWYRQGQEVGLPGRIAGASATSLDDRARGGRDVVVENDIAWRIHSMVDFLFAKPPRFVSTAPDDSTRRAVEAVVQALWDRSGGSALLADMAMLGHIFGHVDLLVRCEGRRRRQGAGAMEPEAGLERALSIVRSEDCARVELIEPRRGVALLDPGDYRRLRGYVIRVRREENRAQSPAMWRRLLGREESATRVRSTHTEIFSATHHQRYEDDRLVHQEVLDWTEGRVPVVHVQNVSQPFQYEGLGEVEPLIPLQDELNTRLSDRAYRLAMQSFKMYLMRGFESPEALTVGPGVLLTSTDPTASVQEFGGDSGSPGEEAHFEAIRNAMDKVSGVPPLATGVVQGKVGNLSSAMALRVTLMGLISRTARKREAYGRGLIEATRLMLSALDHRGVFRTDPVDRGLTLEWPDPLPVDEAERVRAAEGKIRLGVEAGRVLEELGYPDRGTGGA